MLKNQIKLESLNDCLERIKSNLGNLFFETNDLAETYRTEFFYYCLEDDEFASLCQLKNNIKTLDFLKVKLKGCQSNLNTEKD